MNAEQKHFLEYKQKGIDLVNWLKREVNYPEGLTKENVFDFEREYHNRLSKIETNLMESFHSGEITENVFGEKCKELDASDRDIMAIIRHLKESPDDGFGGITFFMFGDGTGFGFGRKKRE